MSDRPLPQTSPNARGGDDRAEPRLVLAGIGASAGGIEALRDFFQEVPADLEVAFLVVIHLAPDHASSLPEILAACTTMPVEQVTAPTSLAAGHVYVIPPGHNLELVDGTVRPAPFDAPRGMRSPIDTLFRSMAVEYGDGFGIVLSGGGSDGSVGIKAIKEAGGLIMVQDPAEAPFKGMPRAAIGTGVVDIVLPVRALAQRLAELSQTKQRVQQTLGGGVDRLEDTERQNVDRILGLVHARTGHDFGGYKKGTVLRRITRRMQVRRVDDLRTYRELVERDAEEIQELFDDLLISVTTFFRDPGVWTALAEQVIPRIFDGAADSDDRIRVWVPGCATGEEAYSLAILLLEEAERRGAHPAIQLFASDLDETALARGREGRYPTAIAADVSEERLRRFFRREADCYVVARELRECVLFASHNLLHDPPFSRLDLVSCRNLLIYLDREVQRQVFTVLRYALRPGGCLLLGGSEAVDESYFSPLDKAHNLFLARDGNLEGRTRLPDLLLTSAPRLRPLPMRHRAAGSDSAQLHRASLEELAPPSALVDKRWQVLHLSETAGRYLRPPVGPPTGEVVALALPELRSELGAALYRALDKGESVLTRPVQLELDGAPRRVAMQVRPRPVEGEERVALVVFLEGAAPDDMAQAAPGDDGPLTAVREELRQITDDYRDSREQYEAGHEELVAANEELQSIAEEYRSTAEELETSKEELQSINEELGTVNVELRAKLDEVMRGKNDLENLIAATDIATLFLDVELRVQWFTPRLTDLFPVTAGDRGRRIGDFTHQLRYPELEADLRQVLGDLRPVEREVESVAKHCYLARARPYRTLDNQIEGVVVTFIDITDRLEAEQALRQNEQRYRLLVESAREYAILVLDPEARISTWNTGAERIFGYTTDEILGRPGALLFTDRDRATGVPEREIEVAKEHGRASDERWHQRKDGELFWASGVMEVLYTEDGSVRGFAKLLRDNTAQKEAEDALLDSQEKLAAELAAAQCLEEMALRAVTAGTLDRTLEAVLGAATRLVRAEAGCLHLLAGDGRSLALSRWQGLPQPAQDMLQDLSIDAEVAASRAFRDARRRVVVDLGQEGTDVERRLGELTGCGSLCTVPLALRGGEPIGVLTLLWRRQGGLGERSASWLEQWANHTSLLLDRSRAAAELADFTTTLERRVAEQTADIRESQERLRQMAASLVRAEQDERRRIAQILHDDLQQLLYGIQMRLVSLRRRAEESDDEKLRDTAERAYGWLGEAIDTTRRLAVDLSPPLLAEEGLGAALGWLADQMHEVQGLRVELSIDESVPVADDSLSTTLFQVARELLFNTVKHAGCDSARLRLESSEERVILGVEDEGDGFAADELEQRPAAGFGLFSIRDRIGLYGGTVDIDSVPGDGTRITVVVPVAGRPQ